MSYNSTFQDRLKSSAEAKKKALEKLKAKAPIDPEVLAAAKARAAEKEAAAIVAQARVDAEQMANEVHNEGGTACCAPSAAAEPVALGAPAAAGGCC